MDASRKELANTLIHENPEESGEKKTVAYLYFMPEEGTIPDHYEKFSSPEEIDSLIEILVNLKNQAWNVQP